MIRFLQTPGPIKKVVLGGLLLVICGAMIIMFIPGSSDSLGFGNPQQGVVAKVAGQDVTAQEVDRAAQGLARQQQLPPQFVSYVMPQLRQRAAEQLIVRKALLAEAERMGFRVSDADVRDEIQHGVYAQTFFPGGVFVGQQAYESMLQSAQLTVPQFEEDVKQQLLVEKLVQVVTAGASVPDTEVQQEFQRRNRKVKFDYAALTPAEINKQIHPSAAELQAYYSTHLADYANLMPEKRQSKYIVLDAAKLKDRIRVTQQDLRAYYGQHQEEYRVPDQVNVRHILIKTPSPGPDGKVDQKAVDAARAKAEDVLKQVKAGGNFAELAKKYSDDPGSKDKGGSLGWIDKGRTVPEFEAAAFSLVKGQTSDVVKSSFGFHIIHVDDKQQAHLKTPEEVKAQIEPVLAQQKASQLVEQLAQKAGAEAKSAGLEKAAKDNGLDVVSSGFFSRSDSLPGLGSPPEFMDAAFAAKKDAPAETVHTSQSVVIYQVTGIQPAATPTFEQAKDQVELAFKGERSTALLAQKLQELADRAHAVHDLKKAAQEVGASYHTSELVTSSSQVPELGPMAGPASKVFDMKVGDISDAIQTSTGGAVLTLLEKQEPTGDELAKQKDLIREGLLTRKRQEVMELFAANLRQQMEKAGKIRINQQELNRLTSAKGQAGS